KSGGSAYLRRRGSRARTSGGFDLSPYDIGGGGASEGGRRSRLRRPDGVTTLCLSGELAGNEDPRCNRVPSHSSFLHALQQSHRLRNRFRTRTDTRTGDAARKLRGSEG